MTNGKISSATFTDIAIDASQVTSGALSLARGGTGKSNNSFTKGKIIYADSTSSMTEAQYAHINYKDNSTSGNEEFVLGNSIASGDSASKKGVLTLYSQGTKGIMLVTTNQSTDWYTATL